MHEAILYQTEEENKVRCALCRHRCLVPEGKRGICGVRENRGGKLYTLVYDRVAAQATDPIEKKPLFHFRPGSLSFSVATMGCNFACAHCQNSTLSRAPSDHGAIRGRPVAPADLVAQAIDTGCRSLSFTYSEPTVFAELALDTARLAVAKDLECIFVTNGYQTPELLEAMKGLIHAANVDLKAFRPEFYKKNCKADLEGVKDTIRRMHGMGMWLEITTLVIPGLNDGEDELSDLAAFIASVDPAIPWHVSRYHPAYRMDRPPTPPETLRRARELGKEAGLRYVYTGNLPGDDGESTFCHACGGRLIERRGVPDRADPVRGREMPRLSPAAGGAVLISRSIRYRPGLASSPPKWPVIF